MKRVLLLALLLFALVNTHAQPPFTGAGRGGFKPQGPTTTGKITGTVIDATTSTPVEFATIVLIDPRQNKQIDGVITDEKGIFKLQEVKTGTYRLQLSFIGYQTKVLEKVELTPEKPDLDLETIRLEAEGVTLDQVTVTGERAMVENRIDKIVYNAEKDVTTLGGDATDVLQRVPLLAVDLDGNVSLRGSGNIQILINGKPSTIFNTNPADALRSFPADQIKAVEVITSPTAKYDGEGTAGIINIITKKKNIEGFTGSINASTGTRTNRGSLNLNYAKGRFGLSLNGSGWYNWPRASFSEFFRENYDEQGQVVSVLDQDGDGDSYFYGPRGSLSAYYDINAFNSINSSFTYRGFGRNNENTTSAVFNSPLLGFNQVYTRINESYSLRSGFDWTSDYRRTFKKPEQELTFGFQISGDNSDTENEILQEGNDPSLFRNENNKNNGLNLEYTLQADYVQPLSSAIKLETGAKAVIRQIDSDFRFDVFDADQQAYLTDPLRSDIFYYDQDVYAGYLSFNIKLGKKYGLIAGARYEHTTIGGDFDREPTTFTNDYDNILPSLIINRQLSQFSNLKLSYAQRIQRPSLRFINPYVDLSDPRDISFGNPELLPEVTDQLELSYNTFVKGIVFNGALYYRYTDGSISSITNVVADVSETTFQNIGSETSIGANIFTSFKVKDWLTLRGGFDIRRFEAKGIVGGDAITRAAYIWRGNLNADLNLKGGFQIQAFGFFNSPSQSLQGFRGSYSQFSLGMAKEMFDKKGSIGFSVIQPFTRFLSFPAEINGDQFFQRSNFGVEVRSFNFNFTYRFGKLDFNQQRRRRDSRIKNDDLKQGDDNNI